MTTSMVPPRLVMLTAAVMLAAFDIFMRGRVRRRPNCPTRLAVCGDDALCRNWRTSSSYEAVSTNDGQAAIARPISVGSTTATLAAKLATLPNAVLRQRS